MELDDTVSIVKRTKSQCGSLGGKATLEKYGHNYMKELAKLGARAMWEKYRLEPVGTSDYALIERATNTVKKIRSR